MWCVADLDDEYLTKMEDVVLDNYGTHKTAKVIRWFARHPRYHLHFTPTSGSWINQVERWFAEMTQKRIPRGSFQRSPIRSLKCWKRVVHRGRHPGSG
jgi:transposase